VKESSRVSKTLFKIEGQPVLLDDKGRFVVTLASGETLKAQSLMALRVKADKTKGTATFPVLLYDRYDRGRDVAFEPATVVGIQKKTGYYPPDFRLADGRCMHQVTLDTPENRAVLKKMAALRKRERDLGKNITALDATLVKRTTRDGVKGLA
jgi:hypothetical protein